ncbi:MAG: MarR family winged helix-turn-helix transcriptional regulator [Nostocoides sp.]
MTSRADDVDRIVAAWHRELPELDLAPMEVLSRVTRLARRLDRIRRDAFTRHGLQTWSFDVLAALRRAGAPYELSPGQLVHETMVTSGTMTNRVDRLVALGLVERRPDPGDRRGVLVRLTEQGRSRVDDAFADLIDRERDLLDGLEGADRAGLAAQLRQVMTTLEAT